jgi:hypothetical protein
LGSLHNRAAETWVTKIARAPARDSSSMSP